MSKQQKQNMQSEAGQKTLKTQDKKISRDRAKLNSFYDFKIDDKKLGIIKQRTWKSQKKVFITGIIFGFFTQYLLGNTRIYQNIVRKATMRRLNAKKKQDDSKQQQYQLRLEKQKKQSTQSKANQIV